MKRIMSIAIFAILTLPFIGYAQAIPESWTLDASGTITSMQDPGDNGVSGFQFLVNNINPVYPTNYCYGGGGGVGYTYPYIWLSPGGNVFTDGGLGTTHSGWADCTQPGNYYLVGFKDVSPFPVFAYYGLTYDGTNVTPLPAFNGKTQITGIVPPGAGIVPTSTPFTMEFQGFIADSDYASGTELKVTYNNRSELASNSALSAWQNATGQLTQTLIFPITSSQWFDLSTTTTITQEGINDMQVQILIPQTFAINFFGLFSTPGFQYGTQIIAASSTYFIAGTTSGYDNFTASVNSALSDIVASSTVSLDSCSSWTSFNLGDCLGVIFLPDPGVVSDAFTSFKNQFLSYAPWGYFTRVFVILSGNATTSLPAISLNMQLGDPNISGGYINDTYSLDPNEMINGGTSMFDNALIPSWAGTDVTFEDVLRPFVDISIAMLLIFAIFHDIMGVLRGGHKQQRKSQLS